MLNKITSKLAALKNDESGASAIEYAVMAALLVVIIVFGISLLGAGDENAGIGKALGNIGDKLEATATP
ncbi:Flp pilus assembly pilin Flp [Zhongshania antarctica]|jgi:Flp pilus assembly pilin Flp|uniref:Flp pilus assembly pilin Flp n=1 Tax=Zhongshania antarctica TaxID=641702 RepID=A0A840R2N5_9GAMM|nr:Flp family type IVb pilin [Zhongshania antarctica]MBB5187345.1 Flp pilus assembly pilin Flp [Zhongshania antarctica]